MFNIIINIIINKFFKNIITIEKNHKFNLKGLKILLLSKKTINLI
jgi:hypothetical protein